MSDRAKSTAEAIGIAIIGIVMLALGFSGAYSLGYSKGTEHLEIKTKISENYRGMEESTDKLIITLREFQDLYYCGPEEPNHEREHNP